MGFFKTMVTSAGWAAGQKLVNGSGEREIVEIERERLDTEKSLSEKAIVRDELESITSLKFGDNADSISDDLNALFAKAAQLPKGFMALGDDEAKAKKKAIIEKIEYGLFKLRRIDSHGSEFFQKKFDELVGKKK
jgi:hypothetical protein